MELSMLSVGEAMLFSLLLGALLGFFYVLVAYVRILLGGESSRAFEGLPKSVCLPILKERQTFPAKKGTFRAYGRALTFFLDICYFFFCGTVLSVFVYSVGGVFRISYVTFTIVGFALFSLSVGKLLLEGSPWFLLGVKIAFWYSAYFLLLPTRILIMGIKFVFLKVWLIFRSLYDKIRTEIYDRKTVRDGDVFGKEWEQCIREEISRSLL